MPEPTSPTKDPTQHQIDILVRMAADLPQSDIAHLLYIIQAAGPNTPGAIIMRRAIAEILALRGKLRAMGVTR